MCRCRNYKKKYYYIFVKNSLKSNFPTFSTTSGLKGRSIEDVEQDCKVRPPGNECVMMSASYFSRVMRVVCLPLPLSLPPHRPATGDKSRVYDNKGRLLSNNRDMCDCLDVDCMGCFYPCLECGSRRCGVECRCDRKWLYEQVEVEGGEIIRNKFAI